MKLSIAALIAATSFALATPTPNKQLSDRQASCAQVNEACLDSASVGLLTPLGPAIALVPGFTLSGTAAQLTCCEGYTCTGGSASLPGSLNPLAPIIGGLPYRSCTNG